jgi:hypothetical protein
LITFVGIFSKIRRSWCRGGRKRKLEKEGNKKMGKFGNRKMTDRENRRFDFGSE